MHDWLVPMIFSTLPDFCYISDIFMGVFFFSREYKLLFDALSSTMSLVSNHAVTVVVMVLMSSDMLSVSVFPLNVKIITL